MNELILEKRITQMLDGLRMLDAGDGEKIFRKILRGFDRTTEMPIGDFPIAMLGLSFAVITPNYSSRARILLLCLFRGARQSAKIPKSKWLIIEKLLGNFGLENTVISDVVFGDIHRGYSEPAETGILPDGAYYSSWLGVAPPTEGFFVRFDMEIT